MVTMVIVKEGAIVDALTSFPVILISAMCYAGVLGALRSQSPSN
ncbi:hypothetical protein [Corynebacterium yudongzhengii]|nr:hypothetical protein [Corynebacterium yudongzhengii]